MKKIINRNTQILFLVGFICGFFLTLPSLPFDREILEKGVTKISEFIVEEESGSSVRASEIRAIAADYISLHFEVYESLENSYGFLFIAIGTTSLNNLIYSVSQLSRYTNYFSHISLLTNQEGIDFVNSNQLSEYFQYILDISSAIPENQLNSKRSWKTIGLLLSPYNNTLYLDSDASVCRSGVDDLFKVLDMGFDIATTTEHDYEDNYINSKIPAIFPQINTGVLFFRRSSSVENLFIDWHRQLLSQDDSIHDQFEFHRQLWNRLHRVLFFKLGGIYNCRNLLPEVQDMAISQSSESISSILNRKGRCGLVSPDCVIEHSNLEDSDTQWVKNLDPFNRVPAR
eukprot:c34051_g1_i1.p1 GENE.c34051_g1_i1~~c34051_g1_i1.p1  ORF type:complete len:343 (-),score=107.37 c34051_g1_i1:36-1064(-)